MPSAVGYAQRNPRLPSGHFSGLLAGIHADPLLLLLGRLHYEPEKCSAPISSTPRYASKVIGRANGSEVWAQFKGYPLNITP